MGNVGRGLDSGTVTMGDFVRAKLEHAGIEQGNACVGRAILRASTRWTSWRLGVNKARVGDDAGGRVPRTVEIRRARRRELSVVARGS